MKTFLLYFALFFTVLGGGEAFAQQKSTDLAQGPVGFQILAVAASGDASQAETLQLYIEEGAVGNIAGELVTRLEGDAYQSFIQKLESLRNAEGVSFFELDTQNNTLKIHINGTTAAATLAKVNESLQETGTPKE